MVKFYYSPIKQKVALLLLAGVTLSLSRSPKTHWTVINSLPKTLKSINKRVLRRVLNEFYKDRMVDFKVEKDGNTVITLTERGKKYALRFKIDELSIPKPFRWDKKWRIVIFDIPEKYKKAREALRIKLSKLGFIQLQKSAWVYPYPCGDVIDFVVEVFEVRKYVHYLEVTTLTNDAKLRLYFKLF